MIYFSVACSGAAVGYIYYLLVQIEIMLFNIPIQG